MLLIIHNCLIRKQRDLFNMIDSAGRVEDCNSFERDWKIVDIFFVDEEFLSVFL